MWWCHLRIDGRLSGGVIGDDITAADGTMVSSFDACKECRDHYARITKRNIRYKVIRVEQRNKMQDEVIRVVVKMTATMQDDQKSVVYCHSRQDARTG